MIQSMILYAVKGKWYPTTSETMLTMNSHSKYIVKLKASFTGWYAQFDDKMNKATMHLC